VAISNVHRSEMSFGRALEINVVDPHDLNRHEKFVVPDGTDIVVLALSDDTGNPLKEIGDIEVDILPPHLAQLPSSEEHREMIQNRLVSAIFINPLPGDWEISVKSDGTVPFAVNAAAINTTNIHTASVPMSTAITMKCRACKTGSKALALAIASAGVVVVHVPAALLAAVASFLGVAKASALVFISSVFGDSVAAITEKLCKKVHLC
jgi:hypothetical protein